MHSPRQIYFAKLRLFSYLMYMYDVHAKTVPTNLDNFVKIGKKKTITITRDYQQSNVSLSNIPEYWREKDVFH